jgi:acetyl coenzyme A synthetase (ADP forming)-like protein
MGTTPATARATSVNRLILRDGSVATVRQATPDDREGVGRFFHDLSAESRRRRLFAAGEAPDRLIEQLCAARDASEGVTLVAERQRADAMHVIAVCSYAALNATTAEVSFAVDDRFHGKGLATAMLERLAASAAQHGFRWLQAMTMPENAEMLEVFRDSGFEVRSKSSQGSVDVRLDVTPSDASVRATDERDRVATIASLEPILAPRAVAVVGVSRDPSSFGRRVFDALVAGGFHGPVYAVNSRCDDVAGHPCYRSARLLPTGVDLGIVAVPADDVLAVIDDCAEAGVRALVVISAGFAEVGEHGRGLQQELLDKARAYGMRLVGPNCMGVLNMAQGVRLNATFSPIVPARGRLAFASQSGALGIAMLQLARDRGIGVSTFVSLGNKADVSGNDLLQYAESDQGTSTILLYLESFGNPRRFSQLAKRVGRSKPIVVVKAGRTRAGSRAAGSHTAALAARDIVVDGLFRQSGVIRAETIDEMFDIATCLDLQALPPGRRLGIVTNAGGPGILAADACEASDLTLGEFSTETRSRLAAVLPPNATATNPVDLIASASPESFRRAIEVVLCASEIDALLVIYTPIDRTGTEDILRAIADGVAAARHAGATNKPVVLCTMAMDTKLVPLPAGNEQLPTYLFPENAVRALGRAAAYSAWRSETVGLKWGFDDLHVDEARSLCRDIAAARGETWLTYEELMRVLTAFGLPLIQGVIARSDDEAVAIAALTGFPVVLKVSSSTILHKTEAGAVEVGLATEAAVRAAFERLAARVPSTRQPGAESTVIVQPMITGVETLVGVTADPLFGPVIAFGLGGVSVEALGDVAFRIAPLTDKDADDLMRSVRAYPMLEGLRGRPAVDVAALRDVILRVATMSAQVPEIREVDLNPVMALPAGHGCRIVDARVRVGP